ncbi:MAG: RHS repeat-associated core domain-containing protein [Chlamydiales bacterium]|nr:RHS repeat-associated core domain-containing protein [Chlamydiales bacterium]
MKKNWAFLFLVLLSSFLSAAEEDYPEVSKEHILDQQENHFLTSTDCRIAPKVNPVTGEYCEEEIDLVVAGSQPLSLRRFYNHTTPEDPRYARWRYNPESFLVANLEWDKEFFAAVGEIDGSIHSLKPSDKPGVFTFQPSKDVISFPGAVHPLNLTLNYTKKISTKDGKLFQYQGTLTDGTGRVRTFLSPMHRWHKKAVYTKKRKHWYSPGSDLTYNIYPAYWTPYHLPIREEKLPNGNILSYTYEAWSDEFRVPHPELLSTITAYNADKTQILGSLHFTYTRGQDNAIKYITVKGSDGRKVVLAHEVREVRPENKGWQEARITDTVLKKVISPSKPDLNYNYRWENKRHYFDAPFLYQCATGSFPLKTDYDLTAKKVLSQSAAVGPNGEMRPIGRYEYRDDHTIVYDPEDQKTIYRFDGDKRITAIEKYDGDQLVQIERSEWNSSNGNLIRKKIEDARGDVLHITEYEYDQNHNVVKERTGDDKNAETILRTFSSDGFNLKLTESDRPGKLIRYTYLPNTNLLTSEITYAYDRIQKRIFHFYDDEITSIRVKTIIDDGLSEDPHDLAHVTFRKIFEFHPKRELPCLGLPEEILEKTIDTHGNELLLNKVCYTYHPSGKVEREDHYDANDVYRYSIVNEYDEKERLIASTDPLGSRTTFTYDANFNLTAQEGPRPDIRKEWSYDKANRPIQVKEWQTDGSILVSEKRYDKCSRLISQTNPCGFETRCAYNGLGQLTTIIHPDGAIESKEYDALGNVVKEIDPNRHTTCKEYNFRGQVTAIYHADGREEHFTYNTDGGTLATHIDPNGSKTVYSYDLFDHPIQTEVYSCEGELLTTRSATFSPFHKLSESDPEGITTHYTYDFAGRLIAKQIGERITSYAYDELGRLAHTQEGDTITSNAYDLKGQLIEKTIHDLDNHTYFRESYAYDEAGNCISVATCGGISHTAYNSRGEPIQKIDPFGNTTDIAYSYNGKFVKTTTNPKGIQTLEIHDARGRLTDLQVKNASGALIQRREKRYDPAGNQTHAIEHLFEGPDFKKTITNEWIYGPNGRIEQLIEAGEKITHYFYDKSGRIVTTSKPDGEEIHRVYDALGRLLRYYGNGIDYVYTYDRKDRLLNVEDKIHKTITNRTYDIYDNLIEEKLAFGLIVRSQYDPYGRRTTLHLPDGSEALFTYRGPYLYSVSRNGYEHIYSERNLAGKPTLQTLPNGIISIDWDPLLRWKKLRSPHYQADCSYDTVGNLTKYSYTDSLGSVKNTYHYDDLNQLVAENTHEYQYDSLYNRTRKDEDHYSLNPLSQITHDGQKRYTYDYNGNLISDGETTYTYDLLDRLISVTKSSTITYTYDAFNRRLSKGNQLYIWDDKNEIGMVHNGKIQELRILGEGLGAEIGSSVIIELNGSIYFPIHNIQGSLAALINPYGKPHETYRHTAFGEQLTETSASPWRFSSKRYDEETDFIYFGRRYYSSNLGRWITPDPQGFEDGPNLYAYVHNGPLTSWDLYGLSASDYMDSFKAIWYRLKGADYAFRDMAFDFASRIGGRTFSNTTNVFDQRSAMMGNWEELSFRNLNDYPKMAFRAVLPYTYDLHHLPEGISEEQRWIAEGKAGFEQGMLLFAGTKGLQSMRGFGFASQRASIVELTSSEYCFSGKVKTPPKTNTGRNKNWLQPDSQAEGAHSVFRRDSATGKVSHYATYRPQTNPYDPKPWESVLRFDGATFNTEGHFNKYLQKYIPEPHMHDPYYPGGVRSAFSWEIPK